MKKITFILIVIILCSALCLSGFAQEAMKYAQKESKKESIKIGALLALSGPGGQVGTPTKFVIEMAAEEINKKGGVAGKNIEVVYRDTEGDPTKCILAAKELIEKEKVSAFIGPVRTGEAMGLIKTVTDSKIPTIACVGASVVVDPVKKYMFKSPQKTETAIIKIYKYLQEKKKTKIGIITANDGFGKDGKKMLNDMSKEYGIEILLQEEFGDKDVDMTTQLTKLKGNDNIQAIICWTIGGAGAIVSKNFKSLDFKIPLLQCHGQPDPKYIELAGASAEGNIMPATKLVIAEQLPDSDPQKKLLLNFTDEYTNKRKYGPVSTHSGYGYDAMMVLAKAIEIAGSGDPDKIRDSIEKVKGYTGISGIYNLSPEDHCGLDVSSMVMVTIENGKWKLIE